MKQIFVHKDFISGKSISLSGKAYNHIVRSLRLTLGSKIKVITSENDRFMAEIRRIEEKRCILEIIGHLPKDVSSHEITLIQCIPKGNKFDLVLRQATEIGVKKIIPCNSRNTIPRYGDNPAGKMHRWRSIIQEALSQCGSPIVPELSAPVSIDKLESVPENSIGLFFHHLTLEKKGIHDYLSRNVRNVYILIGPEGGLTEEEVSLLENRKYFPIYINGNILRTETAAMYAMAIVDICLKERERWIPVGLPAE